MKKLITLFLGIVLFIPAMTFAQNSQQQQDDKNVQQEQNESAQTAVTGGGTQPRHTMSGMVSDAGNALTSGDTSYVVDNPKVLMDHDNQTVSVEFVFDTDTNTIHIISVSPAQ